MTCLPSIVTTPLRSLDRLIIHPVCVFTSVPWGSKYAVRGWSFPSGSMELPVRLQGETSLVAFPRNVTFPGDRWWNPG